MRDEMSTRHLCLGFSPVAPRSSTPQVPECAVDVPDGGWTDRSSAQKGTLLALKGANSCVD